MFDRGRVSAADPRNTRRPRVSDPGLGVAFVPVAVDPTYRHVKSRSDPNVAVSNERGSDSGDPFPQLPCLTLVYTYSQSLQMDTDRQPVPFQCVFIFLTPT